MSKSSYHKLKEIISTKGNLLCVGLDSDTSKIPDKYGYSPENILKFNKHIIELTSYYASAYKINFAFYEKYGWRGFKILEETLNLIPEDIFTIADAKRGDIGNTGRQYASSIYDYFGFDSVTVAPYMGEDSVKPFLEYDGKFTFLLGLTSNSGSNDFQNLNIQTTNRQNLSGTDNKLFEKVLEISSTWADYKNLGYVTGATKPEQLSKLRTDYPDRVFLIPGVGSQGGSPEEVMNANGGKISLVNISRGIIFAGEEEQIIQECKKYSELLKIDIK